MNPLFGDGHPRAPARLIRRQGGRGRGRIVGEAAAGDACFVRHEAEGFPVERRSATGTEMAIVTAHAFLRVDVQRARSRLDLRVRKIDGPADSAARSPLA